MSSLSLACPTRLRLRHRPRPNSRHSVSLIERSVVAGPGPLPGCRPASALRSASPAARAARPLLRS
eukprot:10472497-Alexandrium_andersonii.AAC.1